MFGTLHQWPDKETEFIERPHGSSNLERNTACDRCRAKKVKCNATHDGCSRCESLAKRCKFSGKTGNKKPWKADINRTQLQPPLQAARDMSASSWPSFADTDNGNLASLDGWSQYLEPPPTDKTRRGERCQQEPPEHHHSQSVEDVQTSLDPSSTSGLNEKPASQYTSPGFSSPSFEVVRNLQTEPSQSAAGRTPYDAFSHFLSLNPSVAASQSQRLCAFHRRDSPAFDVSSMDAGTPFDAFTLASMGFAPNDPDATPCYCLTATVLAVEELETSCTTGKRAELDSIIACQKQAITRCRSLMGCGDCMARRDTVVLLVLMTEKIVVACERVASLFSGSNDVGCSVSTSQSPPDYVPSFINGKGRGPHRSLASGLLAVASTKAGGGSTSELADTSKSWQELFLGDYEITCPREWESLVSSLMLLQLTSLLEMLVDLKNVGSTLLGETQKASLTRAMIKLGAIEAAIYTMYCSNPGRELCHNANRFKNEI